MPPSPFKINRFLLSHPWSSVLGIRRFLLLLFLPAGELQLGKIDLSDNLIMLLANTPFIKTAIRTHLCKELQLLSKWASPSPPPTSSSSVGPNLASLAIYLSKSVTMASFEVLIDELGCLVAIVHSFPDLELGAQAYLSSENGDVLHPSSLVFGMGRGE
ncbi:unnamed protein product [Linum trigynum]|uniref:Uncharacterized protein n=1 Tax=Linum trigynum TaxID=586398 RepID=A0AAV2F9R1_9ROSI